MINPIRAVFVGDGSLLVRCAEAFLEAGHEVVCISSADPGTACLRRCWRVRTV